MEPVIDTFSGISAKARRFARFMRVVIRPVFRYSPLTPVMLRLAVVFEWAASFVVPVTRDTEVERVDFPGFHGEWIRPPGADPDKVMLFLHGGGFFCCGLRTHRRLAARIAERAGVTALSVAYRQLPASPLAVSMADAHHAYTWLVEQGFTDIVIAGDSAGGFLALTTALTARDEGQPGPAALVALSPLVELDHLGRAEHPNLKTDAYLPAHRLPKLRTMLLAGLDEDPSPARRDLSGLPPVLIQAGGAEALLYDAHLLAARLCAAGVPHRLQVWEGQLHVFQAFAGPIPEGHAALDEVGAFLRSATGSGHAAA
ncbi:alpha/beta hydrolase [Actinokineospora fastidiosa]|nr:alpha/beta hydrolase [Actinokineospora fastidiosa]